MKTNPVVVMVTRKALVTNLEGLFSAVSKPTLGGGQLAVEREEKRKQNQRAPEDYD